MAAPPPAEHGWILYDAQCAFCTRVVNFWSRSLRRSGLEPIPLQTPWVMERLGLGDQLLQDIRLLLASGETLAGVDVYLYAARRIRWLRPLAYLLGLSMLRPILDRGYRWVAQHRYCALRQY
jgi:predicted DCC family thiol-disulfide oxidoreductase YuxK